ncbi:MAG: tetratricopeptide repeat protein [Sterolibacterium sp.]|jgi:tetratricopeptide (TPR) repeat protein
MFTSIRLKLLPALFCILAAMAMNTACAYDAEVVYVVGKGEFREKVDWEPVKVSQKLNAGSYVRTADFGQMALLLSDNTQVRLNQSSVLQIKEISPQETSTLELVQGRIWAQAKRFFRGVTSVASAARPAVVVKASTATIGIRGTDWDVDLAKDGTTTLTLLSGEADFSNDVGAIKVLPNEQARAQPGKAPTKILLTNAKERVQWVTAYQPQPRRWVGRQNDEFERHLQAIEAGDYSAAIPYLEKSARSSEPAAIVLADIYIALGRVGEAITLLKGRGDPAASALLTHAYIIDDNAPLARETVDRALGAHPDNTELLIARGELARFEGDAPRALRSYQSAITANDQSAEGWFGLGRVDAEREAVKPARAELQRALALNPKGAGYSGELGTLETFANAFASAEQAFTAALAQQPADYNALTGLGILKLKTGQPEEALQAFLKAGVLESHFARAALWTGVAYYQLGGHARAMEMFKHAADLDPKDPLPYMMMSMAAADRLDLGEAVNAARRASALMPYLKSMNQLLNNQKGNANLGASLAQFGMEDWAQAYAFNAYSPYWAGSHLFLADRYSGTFNKNSELFQGFLSDPTVFGASNRFNTLIASPGHYGTVSGRLLEQDMHDRGVTVSANGYSVAAIPFSYFASADVSRDRPDYKDQRVDGDNYAVGLGLKPSHELGLFLFSNSFTADANFTALDQGFLDTTINLKNTRMDAGINYKFSPTSHLWLKLGAGKEEVRFGGNIYAPSVADQFNSIFGIDFISLTGRIVRDTNKTDQKDLQFRHTFDATADWQASWGIEAGHQEKRHDDRLAFSPFFANMLTDDDRKSDEVYVSNRIKFTDTLVLQADLSRVRLTKRDRADQTMNLGDFEDPQQKPFRLRDDRDISEWNPRLGLAWNPAPNQTLRLAVQKWRRPASANTLAPVDTAGIAVDDRLVSVGGELRRLRLQYETEMGSSTFAQGYIDSKQVRNLASAAGTIVGDLNIEDLERLRNRSRLSQQAIDLWEATPEFGAAHVDTLGFAVNRLLADQLTGTLRYQYSRSRNTGLGFDGNLVPWLPRNLLSAGANWLPAARWQLGANLTYRSERYMDEANTQLLKAGWNLGLRSYWESLDKKVSVEVIAENLHADKNTASQHSPTVGAQAIYRF